MATATFSVNGPNVGNYARSYTFTDADAGRVIAARLLVISRSR